MLENPNFLILDEPTNDFDIFTMNILEQFLMKYEECLLLVSHDRYFMDKCADSLFILEDDGNISGFVGKCSEYIEYREEKIRTEKLNKSTKEEKTEKTQSSQINQNSTKKKLSFKEQKEFEQLDKEILELEKEQKKQENLMNSSDFSILSKASSDYAKISKLLEEKYARWEELADAT